MNKVELIGRLTGDPEIHYSQGEKPVAVARYTLAVDRRFKREGEQSADFIRCVAMGKNGEFAEKYLRKGLKIAVCGHIQTGSYTNKDGVKVFTTDVYVEEHEFVESKESASKTSNAQPAATPATPPANGPFTGDDGFMNIPEGIEEGLPFN